MTANQDTKKTVENTMIVETLGRLLEQALEAMNTAILRTENHGPAIAMEYIADYLNDQDAVDERARSVADDWLDRWTVSHR